MANRTIPSVAPPPRLPSFGANPADAEFLRAGLSQEPLVPAWHTRPEDNRALAGALRVYEARKAAGAADGVEPLVAFLADHPDTAWRPSLLVNLGTIYRRTGHLSKALDAWQSAWESARNLDGGGRAIGDAALAKLAQFEAYLGRKELLAPLLEETRTRSLHGSSAELVLESHRGLDDMLERPARSFRCGPLALERILLSESATPSKASFATLDAAPSTSEGLSLSSVAATSAEAGMNYQMAFRTPGAAVVTPAVMHWKVGHYAAIVGKPDGRYQVEDATFGETIRITKNTLDEEASGYFLVPPGPLPEGWRAVATAEGDGVWGRGDTGENKDNKGTGPKHHPPPPPPPPDDSWSNRFKNWWNQLDYGNPPTNPDGGTPPKPGSGSNSHHIAPYVPPGGSSGGCTTWDVELSLVGLQLHDAPVGYTPPVGPPVFFEVYYSHRDVLQPQTFSYVNLGPKWTTTWLSYVVINGDGSADLYGRGGGGEPYTFSNSPTVSDPGPFSEAVLTEIGADGGAPTGLTRQLPDGSVETFSLAQGAQYFMTSVADPQGNAVTVKYDGQMRISSLVDAIGQVTTLSYDLASDPLKVTKVTDPFGRSATFTYTPDGTHLASITDVLGITSSYTYGTSYVGDAEGDPEDGGDPTLDGGAGFDGDFVTTLATPYGTTNFAAGDDDVTYNAQRYLTVTDAIGRVSHFEFIQAPPGIDDSDPATPTGMATTNSYLDYRNTYVWDAQQYAAAMSSGALDYTQARIVHWLHTLDDSTSRVPESVKEPLENRVWFDYPGQTSGSLYVGTSNTPLHAGRLLDDGTTTQLWTYAYNAFGRPTQAMDPSGRTLTFTYDPTGIDLLSIANTTGTRNEVLVSYTYNGQHEPLTRTRANGGTTQYEYNALGQLVKMTDAAGGVTTYSYSNDYLTSIAGPLGAALTFTYDSTGRIATATDVGGETVTFAYDAADRVTSASFPDGTSTKLAYTLLDLTGVTDRLGNTATDTFDAERERTAHKDALGHTVAYGYNPGGFLSSITDANGHETQFVRDAQERLVSTQYADSTSISLAYEQTTSRLLSVKDALGQVTTMTNGIDDLLGGWTYTSALTATAPVTLAYDPAYPRLTSMTDGTGTTSYAYYPTTPPANGAGRLKYVASPVAGSTGTNDTVSYTYDALDRTTGVAAGGATETWGYDLLSRPTSDTSALDTFTLSYADPTARVSGVSSAHGPTVAMAYLGAKNDERLQAATFTAAGAQLSQLGYAYDAQGKITTFTESYVGQKTGGSGGGALAPTSFQGPGDREPSAGDARVLRIAPWALATGLLLLLGWAGRGRSDGKRRIVAVAGSSLVLLLAANCGGGHDGSGPGQGDAGGGGDSGVEGGGSSGQPTNYAYDAANRLLSAAVGTGASSPSSPQYVYAYDGASNLASIAANAPAQALSYTPTNAIASGTYDANGSPTTLGGAQYTWDAANRMLSATNGANESLFTYDGQDRVVRIVQKQSGKAVSDRGYTWCGPRLCVEHDNTLSASPVSKLYFDEGVVVGGTGYYYAQDQLGSVRQLVDATGKVRAQYDYDPYGNRSRVSGDLDSDVGYAGYFQDASGLELTAARAYDPAHGRFASRDPLGAAGGINLYEYAGDDPVNYAAPTGADPYTWCQGTSACQTISRWGLQL
ncbi:MAG TPA: RHS repeat-associated core domain-containing protein [Polyangiaceae bacterium]|jgi:RHS repeat-associated protein